jgi:hypothetical protein
LGGRNLIGAGIVTRLEKLEDICLVPVKTGKLNIDLIKEIYQVKKKIVKKRLWKAFDLYDRGVRNADHKVFEQYRDLMEYLDG